MPEQGLLLVVGCCWLLVVGYAWGMDLGYGFNGMGVWISGADASLYNVGVWIRGMDFCASPMDFRQKSARFI